MTMLSTTFGALWQVVVVGLLLGAGLPAIFAMGVRASDTAGQRESAAARVSERAFAFACFALVLAAVIGGLGLLTYDFVASCFGWD